MGSSFSKSGPLRVTFLLPSSGPLFHQRLWLRNQSRTPRNVAFCEAMIDLPAFGICPSSSLVGSLRYKSLSCLPQLIQKALRRVNGHFLDVGVENGVEGPVEQNLRPEVRIVRMLLVEIESFSLPNLAVVAE